MPPARDVPRLARRAVGQLHREVRPWVDRARGAVAAAREAWRATAPQGPGSAAAPSVSFGNTRTLSAALSEDAFRARAPDLGVRGDAGWSLRELAPREASAARDELLHEGYVVLPSIVPTDACRALVRATEALEADGLPATFLYAYDDAWALGAHAVRLATALAGAPMDLLADLWAFRVPPRDDAAGWTPHRGVTIPLRQSGFPSLVTVWVALSDAPAHGACMHFVPLHRDAAYPHALHHARPRAEHGRAVPMAAGSVLLFDANALHWGGGSSRRAEPRVSITYSAGRRGAGHGEVLTPPLSFDERLRRIAEAIVTYAPREPSLGGAPLAWAMTTARASGTAAP